MSKLNARRATKPKMGHIEEPVLKKQKQQHRRVRLQSTPTLAASLPSPNLSHFILSSCLFCIAHVRIRETVSAAQVHFMHIVANKDGMPS